MAREIAAAARAAGSVEYVVKSSVTGARAPTSEPAPGATPLGHWRGEEALRALFPTTAIRPNIFMQHFLTVPGLYTARAERFYLPTGGGRVSWLDARDIAAAAAALVLASPSDRKEYEGRAYELSGPQAVTAAELAGILGLAARRCLEHVDGADAFSAHCRELGVSDAAKHFYGEAAGGWFARVDDELFTKLLGRHTTSFAKFAMDHASHFGGGGGE